MEEKKAVINWRVLRNYPDSKCIWGYKTICDDCWPGVYDKHVDKVHVIKTHWPADRCEYCGKKGKVSTEERPLEVKHEETTSR